MNWLKRELEAMYQSELKRSDMLWDNITGAAVEEQGYGGTPRSVAPQLYGRPPVHGQTPGPYQQTPGPYQQQQPPVTQTPGEFWQPYIFDTGVGNRKGNTLFLWNLKIVVMKIIVRNGRKAIIVFTGKF